tara:strand:- start:594 stop:794 length:201 start_codon:yes stop_codon:yes gene_type:complete
MKQITKYKMTKQTFEEYQAADIIFDISKGKWGKNRSAIFTATGRINKTKTMPIEIEVTAFYELAKY